MDSISDVYFCTETCVLRLFKEWQKHKSLIVAVDFDDTVFDFHGKGHVYHQVIRLLKECVRLGFHIVIFTASDPERHNFIAEYMLEHDIPISTINKNPINLPYGNNGSKIFYNIFLCDRAGLHQAYEILRLTIEHIDRTCQI